MARDDTRAPLASVVATSFRVALRVGLAPRRADEGGALRVRAAESAFDSEVLEELRSLGYIQ